MMGTLCVYTQAEVYRNAHGDYIFTHNDNPAYAAARGLCQRYSNNVVRPISNNLIRSIEQKSQRASSNDTATETAAPAKRAIVIGASVGMGRAVAKLLAADGYTVGLAARRLKLLEALQQEIPTPTFTKQIDIAQTDAAVGKLEELISEMGGLDLLVISTTGFHDVDWSNRDRSASKSVFDVDIIGFYALAHTGLNFFEKQGRGHLVGFSSLDGLRGIAGCPEYSAAKAFCSRYMEAERNRCIQKGLNITITDIIPGWINSSNDPDYAKKNPKAYWIDSLDDAAQDIFEAIKNKKPVAYITKRWQQVADVIKTMPDELYNALGGI